MYIPASFKENQPDRLYDLIRKYPLGQLVTHGDYGLEASPVPFLLYVEEGKQDVLRAHLAKANPHWKSLAGQAECLVIFQGPDGYVTPSWYPSKEDTHKVVPTWNYATVQVRGIPRVIEDAGWLRRQLDDLTAFHENFRPEPWTVNDAPTDYIANQMKAIVGIEIPIKNIEGKWKMSQNRDAADRHGVIHGMRLDADPHKNLQVAKLIDR